MQYEFLTDIGGFIWWILKGKKSTLKSEQSKKNWTRNLFTLMAIGYVLGYFSVKYIN